MQLQLTKTCSKCGEPKPAGEYRPKGRICKACTAVARREYREKNREREAASQRLWYRKNRDHKLAYRRQYHADNHAEICERRREWHAENRDAEATRLRERYQRNPERYRDLSLRWSREHPEQAVAAATKRRVLTHRLEIGGDDIAYMAVLRADPCAYCGGTAGTIDHLEPLSSGGSGRWDNLTASCRSCNSSKGTATLLAHLARANQ